MPYYIDTDPNLTEAARQQSVIYAVNDELATRDARWHRSYRAARQNPRGTWIPNHAIEVLWVNDVGAVAVAEPPRPVQCCSCYTLPVGDTPHTVYKIQRNGGLAKDYPYCKNCARRQIGVCTDCGLTWTNHYLYACQGPNPARLRGRICTPCRVANYWTCGYCGNYQHNTTHSLDLNGTKYCDACVQKYGRTCAVHALQFIAAECQECVQDRHDNRLAWCKCPVPNQEFKIPVLEGEIRNDELYALDLPGGTLGDLAVNNITQHLANKFRYHLTPDKTAVAEIGKLTAPLWRAILQNEVLLDWSTRTGNFTKRLSRHIAKNYNVKLEARDLETIGNFARADCTKERTLYLQFTRDFNASRRWFINEGSCWWSEWDHGRCMFKRSGGLAIREYTVEGSDLFRIVSRKPISRVFVLPMIPDLVVDDAAMHADPNHTPAPGDFFKPSPMLRDATAFLVFNAYGTTSGIEFARVMAQLYNMTYTQVHMNEYMSRQGLYINGGTAQLVSDTETVSRLTKRRIQIQHSRWIHCDDKHSDAARRRRGEIEF